MLALLPPAHVRLPASPAPASRQPELRPLWSLQAPLLLVASGIASTGLLVTGALPLRLLAIAALALSATIALELLAMRWLRRDLPASPALLPMDGLAARRLAAHRAAWTVVRRLLAPFPSTALRALALRLAGAQVGRGVIIESLASFPDPHLTIIGDGAIFEELAQVMGCDTCHGRLRYAPVTIRERALVCRASILRPASVVSRDAIVCAASEVDCSQRVNPGTYYTGAINTIAGGCIPTPRTPLPRIGG